MIQVKIMVKFMQMAKSKKTTVTILLGHLVVVVTLHKIPIPIPIQKYKYQVVTILLGHLVVVVALHRACHKLVVRHRAAILMNR